MYVLYEESGLSGAEVARRSFVSRQLMHRELQKLNALGWVRQEPSPSDGRVDFMYLTDAGREVIEAAIAPLIDVERDMLSVFSEEERKLLTEFLIRWDEEARRTG
jgi:DNA-binding MarR family transcriptional regulator